MVNLEEENASRVMVDQDSMVMANRIGSGIAESYDIDTGEKLQYVAVTLEFGKTNYVHLFTNPSDAIRFADNLIFFHGSIERKEHQGL